ncbi:UNC5C-like protein [Mya arenaria]|uniref:UNC5C-like protein n=1 Tax=Mya arenaria TaxID=6604 RepID=A0ABY7GCQ3_MYAAR|nr:UNC5C-like protein [Mya arenaria]
MCLKCHWVVQPRHCMNPVSCADSEVCYAERTTCSNSSSTSQFSRCKHCCDSPLCNNKGCGEPGKQLICHHFMPTILVIRHIEDFFVSTVMTPYQPAGAIALTFVDQERHATHTIRAKYSLVDGKFRTWKEGLATAVVVPHVAQVTFVMTNASHYLMANGRFGLSGQRAVQRVVKEQRQGLGLAITPLRAAVENNVLACVQLSPGNYRLAHGFVLSKTLLKSILLCIKYISSDFVNVCLTRNAKQCLYSRCVFHLRKIYVAVDGDWGSWVGWTNCDTKCERGKQFRTRMCNNPGPLDGGANCTGDEIETIGMVWYCRYITQIVEISFCCSGMYVQNNSERIMFVSFKCWNAC